jgi:muramoyltetrapeptide carboxypeptidase
MKQLEFPPFLKEGDRVVILSPSGKIDKKLIKGAKGRLESWGLRVGVSKHAAGSHGEFAGTIEKRRRDLQEALDDQGTAAIFCSRGGYGAVHLIEGLDFTQFRLHPKWLLGFSDITALHNVFQKEGYASMHAPMARHLTMEPEEDESTLLVREMLFGRLPVYRIDGHPFNHPGRGEGILRGGNLSVFYGLRGTPFDIPPKGTILFIEDVSERPHTIERMMYNLKLGGVLEGLSGLIIGQFTEYEEDRSLGKVLYGALADLLKGYDYPVCFNFPVGHTSRNFPLINGAKVTLKVEKRGVELKFD